MLDLDQHLAAIASGDARAFARWLAGAEARVRLSLRSFAAQVDTEAVMQETLLRVWQVAPRFAPDGRANGLLRLAIRIARNLAVSETRRPRATPLDEGALDAERERQDPQGPAVDPLLRKAIEDCSAQLPEKPAQALAARLAGGGVERDEALAERLAMRLNTFLQNFTRARRLLADCLRRHGIDLDEELA
jgi:DNA-directed RNA polymerase specialized sigma24 family protein